jgi:hypothetical protein
MDFSFLFWREVDLGSYFLSLSGGRGYVHRCTINNQLRTGAEAGNPTV